MNDGKRLQFLADMTTRRRMIVGAATTLAGAILWPATGLARAGDNISEDAESIHQEPSFKAAPQRVYEALINTKQFDGVTQLSAAIKEEGKALGNKPTAISNHEGGAFVLFGGYITGRQVELIPNKRIVEAWRAGSWESGVYSIARFELMEQGSGTKIVFDHTGFPKGLGQHLAAGWRRNYWEPLEKFLA